MRKPSQRFGRKERMLSSSRQMFQKRADVKALVEKTVAQFGHLDIAFNNAGIEGVWVPIIAQSEEDWERTINVNLKGVWLSLKYEIKQMLKQRRGGAIVNMASTMGLIGSAGAAAYTASKHGVIGLTKTAALETAKSGIRINAICPGVIETSMSDRLFGAPKVHQYVQSCHPIGRFGKPAGSRRSCAMDVLRPRFVHDGPVAYCGWRVSCGSKCSQAKDPH